MIKFLKVIWQFCFEKRPITPILQPVKVSKQWQEMFDNPVRNIDEAFCPCFWSNVKYNGEHITCLKCGKPVRVPGVLISDKHGTVKIPEDFTSIEAAVNSMDFRDDREKPKPPKFDLTPGTGPGLNNPKTKGETDAKR